VIAFPNLYQVMSSQANATVTHIQQSIPSWAASQAGSGLSAAALQQIFQVQTNLIIGNNGLSLAIYWLFHSTHLPLSSSHGTLLRHRVPWVSDSPAYFNRTIPDPHWASLRGTCSPSVGHRPNHCQHSFLLPLYPRSLTPTLEHKPFYQAAGQSQLLLCRR
jgi:hypothetical protein